MSRVQSGPDRKKESHWLCLYEGEQEYDYLEHISGLLHERGHIVKFEKTKIYPSAKGIPEALWVGFEGKKCALFDHDGRDVFAPTLKSCKKGLIPAYSNRNFDLWLLLHKMDYGSHVSSNDAYQSMIRDEFGLPKTANIKEEKYRKRILDKITYDDVIDAIRRAKAIQAAKSGGTRAGTHTYYDNPDLSIHIFLEEVLNDCGEKIT